MRKELMSRRSKLLVGGSTAAALALGAAADAIPPTWHGSPVVSPYGWQKGPTVPTYAAAWVWITPYPPPPASPSSPCTVAYLATVSAFSYNYSVRPVSPPQGCRSAYTAMSLNSFINESLSIGVINPWGNRSVGPVSLTNYSTG